VYVDESIVILTYTRISEKTYIASGSVGAFWGSRHRCTASSSLRQSQTNPQYRLDRVTELTRLQHSKMAAIVAQQQTICPYLPPELWQRVLFQHTDPTQLWSVGRQVCSTWRSEIPKLFAKKYLEDPAMVKIHFDLGTVGAGGKVPNMVVDMVFDRYEGATKDRCVFAENPLTTGARIHYLSEPGWRAYERKKSARLRRKFATYLGSRASATPAVAATAAKKSRRGRFDLPPHRIQIKSTANDTQLPNLALNLKTHRSEISFEWHGMLAAFFSEAALQSKKERAIMAPLMRTLKEEQGTCSLAHIMALIERSNKARHASRKRIRRARIKEMFLSEYDLGFADRRFNDTYAEQDALSEIEQFERHGWRKGAAEDAEERRIVESDIGFRGRFDIGYDVVTLIREFRGIGERDEDSLIALYDEMEKAEAEARIAGYDRDSDDEDSDDVRLGGRVRGDLPLSVYHDSTEGEDGDSGLEECESREEHREAYGRENSEEAE
jgi:hypothetical protein